MYNSPSKSGSPAGEVEAKRLPTKGGAHRAANLSEQGCALCHGRTCAMKPKRVSEVYEFLPDKFFPRLVYGSGRTRAFLLCLGPGQELAPRADSEEMVCYLIEGRQGDDR